MMAEPITDRRRRPTPEPGARWLDYVPAWARVGAPVVMAIIAIVTFGVGWGEGQGKASAEIGGLTARAERYERQRDGDQTTLGALRSDVAELRGEVRAIGRALGVLLPSPSRLPPEGAVIREVGPEVTP